MTAAPRHRWPDRPAAVGLAVMAVAWVASLAVTWGARPEYADRFLVLLGAGYAARRAWPTATANPTSAATVIGLLLVLLAAVAFPVAWLLQVQIGTRVILLWWQAAAVVGAAAGVVLTRFGFPKLRAVAFSLAFLYFALPIPSRVLDPLQSVLQHVTTWQAEVVLSMLFHVERLPQSFVLTLPGGPLEVAEACSGVRSLTALLALAAFVAFLRGFGPAKGVSLLVLTVPVIVLTNALRVILSGVIQEAFGSRYIQGEWHEALGFAMVFVGLGAILGLASALGGKAQDAPPDAPPLPPITSTASPLASWAVAALLLLSSVGTGYAGWLGYQAFQESLQVVPLDRIPLKLVDWTAPRDEAIPGEVTSKLGQDAALYRVYENNLGQKVHAWVLYWSSVSAVRGYHHPDVCWGNRGGVLRDRRVVPIRPTAGGEVPVTSRTFDFPKTQHLVLYWTQDGRTIWDEATEQSASQGGQFGSGSGWVIDLLSPPKDRPPGRLVVLLATSHVGPQADRQTRELARQLADELYAACPWAAPLPRE